MSVAGCDDAAEANRAAAEHCWTIEYVPREGLLHPIPPRMAMPNVTKCVNLATIEHEFTYPGEYKVCVSTRGQTKCSLFQNRYVHRHVMAMTQEEFDDFAHAFNTMRNTSTEDGRRLYGDQCPGSPDEFYTHDVFVSLHSNMAGMRIHDRLHYLELQEPAHLSWTMKMQQSLRCICPSCSHPFFEPVVDYDEHATSSDAFTQEPARQLVQSSPVWGTSRYGGRGNHDLSALDPAYVIDGKFKYFPITQNSSAAYWCDPLMELSGPEVYHSCEEGIRLRKGSMTKTGITVIQPKPVSDLEYVSRRPYFYMHDQQFCPQYIDTILRPSMQGVRTATKLQDMWLTVSAAVHSFGHHCISGKWTPDGSYMGFYNPLIGNDIAVNTALWYTENSTVHPLFLCGDDRCQCNPEFESTASRWFTEYAGDQSRTGGTYKRASTQTINTIRANGCNWPRTGTFDWSASANQDPTFYMHHFFTFYATDLGYKSLVENTGKSIVELAEELPLFQNNRERPGNNLGDTTYFKNLIPYKEGQVQGSYHTWKEILEYQTSHRDFIFEEA